MIWINHGCDRTHTQVTRKINCFKHSEFHDLQHDQLLKSKTKISLEEKEFLWVENWEARIFTLFYPFL